ncbi:MAG: hypothetical protein V1836_01210 [Candidatus Aenigmatarchaeota archaeon]
MTEELVSKCYNEIVNGLHVNGRYAQPPKTLTIEKRFTDSYAKNVGTLQRLEKKITQLEGEKPGKKLDRMRTELELKYTRKMMELRKRSAEHYTALVSDAAYHECYRTLRTTMHGSATKEEQKIEDALSDLAASVFTNMGQVQLMGTIYLYASDQELRARESAAEIARIKTEERKQLYHLIDQVGASVPHNYKRPKPDKPVPSAKIGLLEGRTLGYLAALGMETMSKEERMKELESLLKENDRNEILIKLEAFGKKGAQIYSQHETESPAKRKKSFLIRFQGQALPVR